MANALTKIQTNALADDAVTLAKQAAGTDGQIITYDASGNPTAVGPGTDGQVLTSTGAGSPPAFEDVATTDTKSFRNILYNGAMEVNQRGTVANAGKPTFKLFFELVFLTNQSILLANSSPTKFGSAQAMTSTSA